MRCGTDACDDAGATPCRDRGVVARVPVELPRGRVDGGIAALRPACRTGFPVRFILALAGNALPCRIAFRLAGHINNYWLRGL